MPFEVSRSDVLADLEVSLSGEKKRQGREEEEEEEEVQEMRR